MRDKSVVQRISSSPEDIPFRHRLRIPPLSPRRQALTSSCLAVRGRQGPPARMRRGSPNTARSSEAARPGIVPLGEIKKTPFGERIGILGQTAGEYRPLPEKLAIHCYPHTTMSALQDTQCGSSSHTDRCPSPAKCRLFGPRPPVGLSRPHTGSRLRAVRIRSNQCGDLLGLPPVSTRIPSPARLRVCDLTSGSTSKLHAPTRPSSCASTIWNDT